MVERGIFQRARWHRGDISEKVTSFTSLPPEGMRESGASTCTERMPAFFLASKHIHSTGQVCLFVCVCGCVFVCVSALVSDTLRQPVAWLSERDGVITGPWSVLSCHTHTHTHTPTHTFDISTEATKIIHLSSAGVTPLNWDFFF